MAKRYGNKPSDFALDATATVMERQMFDLFVFSVGLTEENRRAKEAQRKAKRR